jgi:hypothetical protein
MAQRIGMVWIDAQGQRILNILNYTGTIGGVVSALEAKSQGFVLENWAGTVSLSPGPAGTATYPTVRVAALLTFVDATNSEARVILPAPDAGIFLPDGTTVDPTQITGIISAVVGTVLAGSGSPVVAFLGGQLIQSRLSGIATT